MTQGRTMGRMSLRARMVYTCSASFAEDNRSLIELIGTELLVGPGLGLNLTKISGFIRA